MIAILSILTYLGIGVFASAGYYSFAVKRDYKELVAKGFKTEEHRSMESELKRIELDKMEAALRNRPFSAKAEKYRSLDREWDEYYDHENALSLEAALEKNKDNYRSNALIVLFFWPALTFISGCTAVYLGVMKVIDKGIFRDPAVKGVKSLETEKLRMRLQMEKETDPETKEFYRKALELLES